MTLGLILVMVPYMEISDMDYIIFEEDFSKFMYPQFGDIRTTVDAMISGPIPMNWENKTEPQYRHVQDQRKFTALMNHEICSSDYGIELVYLIKSAPENYERRAAIRKTWGKIRLGSPSTRTVFLIGLTSSNQTQERLRQEHLDHGMDLVQGDFADHYYNSTLKTMMALKWAATVCPRAKYYCFFDDDYYVSNRNLFKFLSNSSASFKTQRDEVVFAGRVQFSSPPVRSWGLALSLEGKWAVSLEDYPYNRYPPFINGGSYILSNKAMRMFYYGSMFVKPYIFDDVHLGIIAKKLGIDPFHSDEFRTSKWSLKAEDFAHIVACHEFSDPCELERVWSAQKMAGYA